HSHGHPVSRLTQHVMPPFGLPLWVSGSTPTGPSDPRGLVRPHDPDHRLPPSAIRRARCVEPSSGADTVNVFVRFDACADGPFHTGAPCRRGARGGGGAATAGRAPRRAREGFPVAEGGRFELPRGLPLAVFKTAAIARSAIPPLLILALTTR